MKKKNALIFALCTTVLVSPSTSKCLIPQLATTVLVCLSYKFVGGAIDGSNSRFLKRVKKECDGLMRGAGDIIAFYGDKSWREAKVYMADLWKESTLWERYNGLRKSATKHKEKLENTRGEKTWFEKKICELLNKKESRGDQDSLSVSDQEEEKTDKNLNLQKAKKNFRQDQDEQEKEKAEKSETLKNSTSC